MQKDAARAAGYPVEGDAVERPSDSMRGASRAGWSVVFLFFGCLGGWAAYAPLNAAVVGDGVVKVEGNRKSLQHLDGGTVKRLLAHEGDRVAEGDILMVLDDSALLSEVSMLEQQRSRLHAVEARLRAEMEGLPTIAFPDTLDPVRDRATIADQIREFGNRRAALSNRETILRQRMAQNKAQALALQAQLTQLDEQLSSFAAEEASVAMLVKKGLATRSRLLELQRRESEAIANKAKIQGSIDASQDAIAELVEQSSQLQNDQRVEVSASLSDVRLKLSEIEPKLDVARLSLERTQVRSPYTGTVVDLAVFSVGAVVRSGERLLDIVPDNTDLRIEAKIRVEDIADLRPGMPARMRFTSYKQRSVPLIDGLIEEISADRLVDERTQMPYYVISIAPDARSLAAAPEIELYPGMPATVMVTTKERSALEYIVSPLIANFEGSLNEI